MSTFNHVSVMLEPVLAYLAPVPGGIYVDGTLGGGGHSAAILARIQPGGRLYGIDRDLEAIAAARARLSGIPGFTPLHGNFHDMKPLLAGQGVAQVQGALLDLGVSSYQLDEGERGFSFHQDAPLDMRMDQTQDLTAREVVNTYDQAELAQILYDYGEEPWAKRIAQVICERRTQSPLETTGDLVACIDAAIPKRVRLKAGGHPARQTFQALRIAVNDELAPLAGALGDAVALLAPGGRLCVITFHSLEDRIVKQTLRGLQNPCTCPPKAPVCICGKKPLVKVLGGGAIRPSTDEVQANPRARSATLRVAQRL